MVVRSTCVTKHGTQARNPREPFSILILFIKRGPFILAALTVENPTVHMLIYSISVNLKQAITWGSRERLAIEMTFLANPSFALEAYFTFVQPFAE